MTEKMKGGIRQRGDSWLIKYYGGRDENGRRKQCYATVHGSRTDAIKKRRELLTHVDKGTHVDRSKVTVAEWLEKRLAVAKVSRKTLERYRELAKYITDAIGSIPLQQLTADRVERFYSDLEKSGGRNGAPLSPTTARHVHQVFKRAMNAARRLDVIALNPFEKLEKADVPKKTESRAVSFDPDQLRLLLQNLERAGDWLYPLVRLAAQTGMRRGELLALRWGAVDLDQRIVRVREALEEVRGPDGVSFKAPKSKKGLRDVRVSDAVTAELRVYWKACAETALKFGVRLTGESLVFPASPEKPQTPRKPRSVSEAFTDRLAKYKIRKTGLSFHSLRHTHASILLHQGVSIPALQKRLGHAKPSITLDTYIHEMPGDDGNAATIMDRFLLPNTAAVMV